MGLNDRDYGHSNYEGSYGYGQQPGLHLGSPNSVVIRLVIINAVVYVLQLMFREGGQLSWFDQLFSMHDDWFYEPWRIFELVTYGFLHDPFSLWHILGNMFVLWMFGRNVEDRLGSKEFLTFYLLSVVSAATLWNLTELFVANTPPMLGASGGVSAVLLLFIFYYPRMTLLFMFVIPMPAWLLGVFIVGSDVLGAVSRSGEVAFTAHLGGFLFALLYYKSGIRLTNYVPTGFGFKMPSFKSKPNLRVHDPNEDDEEDANDQRLDELLEKVAQGGQESLTNRERRELQKLSKHYQQKRR